MFKRGDIYYINDIPSKVGNEMPGGRPAIIVSNNKNHNTTNVFEVVFLTTKPQNPMPTHVSIKSAKYPSTALCEQIHSVSINRVGNWYGLCSDKEMEQINEALAMSLGLTLPEKDEPVEPVEEDSSVPVPASDPATDEQMLKLEVERDVYKKMYEQLLERLTKGGA